MKISFFNSRKINEHLLKQSYKIIERNDEGYYVLKFSKILFRSGLVLFISGFAMGIFLQLIGEIKTADDFIVNIISSGIISLIGIFMMMMYFNSKVMLDDEKITFINIFLRKSVIYYHEITSVKISFVFKKLSIKTNHNKINIIISIIGFYTIIFLLKKRVNEMIISETVKKIDDFYQHFGLEHLKN